MCKLITASVAAYCLFVLASTCNAQTTNINRVNGNGNTVVNRTTGSNGSTTNINRVNGNGNTVVNRTTGSIGSTTNLNRVIGNGNTVVNRTTGSTFVPSQRVVVVGQTLQPVEYAPAPAEYIESAPVEYYPSAPVTYAPAYYPAPIQTFQRVTQSAATSRLPSVNLNINAINGNGNRVVNGTTGGGGRSGPNININAINGNGNRVVNGTTGGRTNVNINAINGNRNTVVNRSRP